jgi:hypothetical protein
MHHNMKRFWTLLPNVAKRVHVAQVYIQIGISRELYCLMLSSGPFLDGSVELIQHISTY